MIAAIVLAVSNATHFGLSPFVEEPHNHAWEFLIEEDSGRVWWDRNYQGTRSVNGKEFPAVLMRVVANDDHWVSKLFKYQDIIQAINCEKAEIAEIDEIKNGQRVADPWGDARGAPQFSAIPNPDDSAIQSMMLSVCDKNESL